MAVGAFVLANLVLKFCDVFFPSSATASLIVANTLKICNLPLRLVVD